MIYKIQRFEDIAPFLLKKNYDSISLCFSPKSNQHERLIASLKRNYHFVDFNEISSCLVMADCIIVLDKTVFFKLENIQSMFNDILYLTDEQRNPFIVSIPKSGTNLIHRLLEELQYEVIGDGAKKSYPLLENSGLNSFRRNSYIPFNNFVSAFAKEKNIALSSHYLPLNFITTSSDYGNQQNNQDYFREWTVDNKIPILFNLRDPRDTIISLIHYIESRPSFTYWNTVTAKILSEFETLSEKVNHIINYANSFLDIYYRQHMWLYKHPAICKIKFEDLVGPLGESTHLKQYLAVCKVIIHVSRHGDPKVIAKGIYSADSRTYRKGTIGEWKSSFSQKNNEDFFAKFGDILSYFNYHQ